jgi:nitrous oxide reductase
VGALSIRYCDVDNNLIVEFDRDEITAYLQNLDIIGDSVHLSVIVEGTIIVTCSLGSVEEIEQEVSEVSEIVVFGKRSRKKKLR